MSDSNYAMIMEERISKAISSNLKSRSTCEQSQYQQLPLEMAFHVGFHRPPRDALPERLTLDVSRFPEEQVALEHLKSLHNHWLTIDVHRKRILEFLAYSCFSFQRDEELLGDLIGMHRCLPGVSHALAIAIENPPDIYCSRIVDCARDFCRLLEEFVQEKITHILRFLADAISIQESEANTVRSATVSEEDIAERMSRSLAASFLTYNALVTAWEMDVPNVVEEA